MTIAVTKTSTETCLWSIERELMNKYGVDQARRYMEPLHYYINTGRASDEAIKRVQSYIGYTPYTI